MIRRLFHIAEVSVSDAYGLYPGPITWRLQPGVNVVVGGTGLGKTTLVNATLFTLFGELFQSDRLPRFVDTDYLTRRLVSATENESAAPPQAMVEAAFGKSKFSITKDLSANEILRATKNGRTFDADEFEERVCEALKIEDFSEHLQTVVEHLLYVSDRHYYLSWDTARQNDIILLLFADLSAFNESHRLWDQVQQLDSAFRNARYQAGILQKELDEDLLEESPAPRESIEGKRSALREERKRADHRKELAKAASLVEQNNLRELEEQLSDEKVKFEDLAKQSATFRATGPDDKLTQLVFASDVLAGESPLGRFLRHNPPSPCPACFRVPRTTTKAMTEAARRLKRGACPVCAVALPRPRRPTDGREARLLKKIQELGDGLLQLTGEVEATRSRFTVLREELARAEAQALVAAREEYEWNVKHPQVSATEQKRSAWRELVARMNQFREQRDARLVRFTSLQAKLGDYMKSLYGEIAREFGHFAGLFLDEPCSVQLDLTGDAARRRGPQIDPTHAAFYPVIAGVPRYRSDDLSEAQRLFVDIAFRMAVLETWRKRTGGTATFILETPEGTVDLAYMVRVSRMLCAFAAKGHTLIATTNLNNEQFLPGLFEGTPKRERRDRVLNLLELGRPRGLQREYMQQFDEILDRAFRAPYRSAN